MSRGRVVYGRCPHCFSDVPLIWDGTVGSHDEPEQPLIECAGSYFAPVVPEVGDRS